jgi:hypothetical protein
MLLLPGFCNWVARLKLDSVDIHSGNLNIPRSAPDLFTVMVQQIPRAKQNQPDQAQRENFRAFRKLRGDVPQQDE